MIEKTRQPNKISEHHTLPYLAGFAATVVLSSTLIFTWAHASTDVQPRSQAATKSSDDAVALSSRNGDSPASAAAPSRDLLKDSPIDLSKVESKVESKDANDASASKAPDLSGEERSQCLDIVAHAVRIPNRQRLQQYCSHTERLPECVSVEGRPIAHLDSISESAQGKRVLVLGLIHGDETLAGEMTVEWAERLLKIPHRNSWRVVGLLNPDGLYRRTRMNAHGVDLNRNFPTRDWPEEAQKYWAKSSKSDPRRFPGDAAASEPETKCAIAQIKNFKPDFIISVHTPYHVLDFDGPKLRFPPYRDLPWRALGNYPGSLGRFMWKDMSVPVLTIELGQKMVDAAQLQDIVGGLAIEAANKAGAKTASTFISL